MTSAIMLSFVIPALVAATLTVLLIKERDYLFNHKHSYSGHRYRHTDKEHHSEHKLEEHKNDQTYIDFSGGMMGL